VHAERVQLIECTAGCRFEGGEALGEVGLMQRLAPV